MKRVTLEMQRKAKALYEQMREMRHEYNEVCKAAFPVGTMVSYAHGDQLRFGRVVDVGYGHRVKIEGVATAYWIETYKILDELEV